MSTPQGFTVSCVENDDYIKFFRYINNYTFADWVSYPIYFMDNFVTGWFGSFFTGGFNCTNTKDSTTN